jgi:muramidase (phage lysozyme)
MTYDPAPGELRCLALVMQRESGGRYDVLAGGATFAGYAHFPQWDGWEGSHAAGAYQFEPATWAWIAGVLGLADFSPLAQNLAALWLLRLVGPNSSESWQASGPYPTPEELANA